MTRASETSANTTTSTPLQPALMSAVLEAGPDGAVAANGNGGITNTAHTAHINTNTTQAHITNNAYMHNTDKHVARTAPRRKIDLNGLAAYNVSVVDGDDMEVVNESDSTQGFAVVGGKRGEKRRNDATPTDTPSKCQRNEPSPTGQRQQAKTHNPELWVYMRTQAGKSLRKLCSGNPCKFAKSIEIQCGRLPNQPKWINEHVMRLTCKDELQRAAILEVTEVMESPVTVTPYKARTKTRSENENVESKIVLNRGVIYNVPTEVTDDEILSDVQYAKKVWRVKKNGAPTQTVFLDFDGTLPKTVRLGYTVRRVAPYTPRPLQCLHCLLFGHKAAECRRSQPRCERCAGNHSAADCTALQQQEVAPPRCALCKGPHPATDKTCPKRQEMAQALKYRANNGGVKLREAVRLVRAKSKDATAAGAPKPASQPDEQAAPPPARTEQPLVGEGKKQAAKRPVPRPRARPAMVSVESQTEPEQSVEKDTQTGPIIVNGTHVLGPVKYNAAAHASRPAGEQLMMVQFATAIKVIIQAVQQCEEKDDMLKTIIKTATMVLGVFSA